MIIKEPDNQAQDFKYQINQYFSEILIVTLVMNLYVSERIICAHWGLAQSVGRVSHNKKNAERVGYDSGNQSPRSLGFGWHNAPCLHMHCMSSILCPGGWTRIVFARGMPIYSKGSLVARLLLWTAFIASVTLFYKLELTTSTTSSTERGTAHEDNGGE